MHTNALQVLRDRGFVEWTSHNEELEEHFKNNMVTGYIGFDPSADSLHVGNLVAIMGLAWLQRLGHRPIAIAGGGTGRIGDPSGKSAERNLLSEEQILHNVSCIANQLRHFLNFDSGENSALLVNNNDWLKNENYIEFLRDTGKYFTVSFLVNREYVRSRVLDPDKSITYTELSYILAPGLRLQPPLQRIRMHAPDGRQRPAGQHHRAAWTSRAKNPGGQCYGITFPLLLNAQGQKFGKSESGAVYLSPERTSVYKFYQFWINVDDKDLEKLFKLFTFRELDEIKALLDEHAKAPHLRRAQKELAWEMTCRVHGEEAAKRVRDASAVLFGEASIKDASQEVLDTLSAEIPCAEADLAETAGVTDLLVLCGSLRLQRQREEKNQRGRSLPQRRKNRRRGPPPDGRRPPRGALRRSSTSERKTSVS